MHKHYSCKEIFFMHNYKCEISYYNVTTEHTVLFSFLINWCGQFIVPQVQGHTIKWYAILLHMKQSSFIKTSRPTIKLFMILSWFYVLVSYYLVPRINMIFYYTIVLIFNYIWYKFWTIFNSKYVASQWSSFKIDESNL